MRAVGAGACIFFAATALAMAQSRSSAAPGMPPTGGVAHQNSDETALVSYDDNASVRYQSGETAGPSRELAIGPLRLKIDNSEIARPALAGVTKHAQAAHVQFENVRFFGGNISGAFDGRSATLRLSWPTSN